MRLVSWAVSFQAKVDWAKPQNIIRISVLSVIVVAVVAGLIFRDYFGAGHVGYGAVVLSSLVGSAGLLIPVPALATACLTATKLSPFLVGLIAATSESVGELSGYYLGYTNRDVLTKSRMYHRFERWMQRKNWLLLFLVSVIPNPIFDVVGIAAGALRYPVRGFLAVVWSGKLLKWLTIAYACSAGAEWITDLIPWF